MAKVKIQSSFICDTCRIYVFFSKIPIIRSFDKKNGVYGFHIYFPKKILDKQWVRELLENLNKGLNSSLNEIFQWLWPLILTHLWPYVRQRFFTRGQIRNRVDNAELQDLGENGFG